jgi:EAL domain-containing protein (putative c-di-GMP-specific phosphodiesterase class I)
VPRASGAQRPRAAAESVLSDPPPRHTGPGDDPGTPDEPHTSDAADTEVQRLLDLARLHLDMEVAWVSRFSNGEQVIHALSGDGGTMGVQVGAASPLPDSFCVRVLAGTLPAVVPDARVDLTARDLDVTHRLDIGSYVGAPLRGADGEATGMLCCLSRYPDPRLDENVPRYLALIADLLGDHLTSSVAAPRRSAAASRRQVQALLDRGDVPVVFQPVVRLRDGAVVAYQALARFEGFGSPRPDLALAAASRCRLGVQLELLAARAALRRCPHLPQGTGLGINFSAEALMDPGVVEVLARHADAARRGGRQLGVEITEHSPVTDYPALCAAVQELRAAGVLVAVDDAGAGYASLRHILQLAPDAIKIDISLVHDVDTDPVRQALTRSLNSFADEIGAHLIAEGVERRAQADTLRRLGIRLAQGYLFARPRPLGDRPDAPGAAGA